MEKLLGITLLMLAANCEHLEIVCWLVEAGANKEQTLIDNGYTPLHMAVQQGNLDIVRLLIDAGANNGETAKTPKKKTYLKQRG